MAIFRKRFKLGESENFTRQIPRETYQALLRLARDAHESAALLGQNLEWINVLSIGSAANMEFWSGRNFRWPANTE